MMIIVCILVSICVCFRYKKVYFYVSKSYFYVVFLVFCLIF